MKHIPFYLMDIWYGEQSLDLFGSQIQVGDVDGDGQNEVIISSPTAVHTKDPKGVNPQERFNSGKVFVYKGMERRPLHEWVGVDHHVHFGYAIALGDLNGDGQQEVIISAPFEGNEDAVQTGAIHIYSGKTGERLNTIYGQQEYQRMGYTLATGDVNGDGYDDIIVTSSLLDADGKKANGMVEVYSGKDNSVLHSFTISEKEQLGYSLAAADIDKDGYDDILIGAPEASTREKAHCGKVYVYSGQDGHQLQELEGKTNDDRLGTSVQAADVNGDEVLEVVVGSCFSSSKGYAYNGALHAFSSKDGKILYTIEGDYNYAKLGTKVLLHDIDQDGMMEIITGTQASYTLVLDGRNGEEIKKIHGEVNTIFSSAIASGDVDGDGHNEVLISSLSTLHEGEITGAIYLFSANPHLEKRGEFTEMKKSSRRRKQPSKSLKRRRKALRKPTSTTKKEKPKNLGTGPYTGPGTAPGTGPGTELFNYPNKDDDHSSDNNES